MKACSAVEIVLPLGVFITITPWSVAASRSMLSTPDAGPADGLEAAWRRRGPRR